MGEVSFGHWIRGWALRVKMLKRFSGTGDFLIYLNFFATNLTKVRDSGTDKLVLEERRKEKTTNS